MSTVRHDQSLGELFSVLVQESRTLIRQEVQLAKTELKENATAIGRDAGKVAAGGVVLLIGSLALIAAAIIGLGHLIGYGWSSLLIGLVITIAGGAVSMSALKRLKNESLKPEQTVRTIKETKIWAKEQIL